MSGLKCSFTAPFSVARPGIFVGTSSIFESTKRGKFSRAAWVFDVVLISRDNRKSQSKNLARSMSIGVPAELAVFGGSKSGE